VFSHAALRSCGRSICGADLAAGARRLPLMLAARRGLGVSEADDNAQWRRVPDPPTLIRCAVIFHLTCLSARPIGIRIRNDAACLRERLAHQKLPCCRPRSRSIW